ncbi:MAG: LysR family transcriptional regulator [Thiohalomonadaceae bacterium]
MVDETETLGGAIEDLRAFCAVIELGSISAAARQLGETKGSLSRRISRLEGRLGVRLLSRTPRAVSASEEGIAFYGKCRDALVLLDEAAEGARQSRVIPRGQLRVTAPYDIGLEVLPALLNAFHREHPQITVELLLNDATLDLAANRIDLALRATTGTLPDMGYRASALVEFGIRLYASPAYLAPHPPIQDPAGLAGHALIASREDPRGAVQLRLYNHRGKRETRVFTPIMHVSDFAAAHRLLLTGAGIGAIPDLVAAPSLANGKLLAVLPEWELARAQLHAISVGGREAPARVRVFREFIRSHLGQMLQANPSGRPHTFDEQASPP